MSNTFEKLEHNMAKLTINVPAEEFEKAMEKAYQKNKGRLQVAGFRKGKAPRAMIEKMYGEGIFFEDAANFAISETYEEEIKSTGLDIVSRPSIDVEQIEKGKDFIYTAEVALKPEASVKKYKGLEIAKQDVTVSDEDVDREIEKEREKNARQVDVDDRAAILEDTVNIDFEGFVDGVAFDGGKGEGYDLVLGSGTFIPGFEDQLVGKSVGEDVEVNVTFPEEYGSEDLQGKDALFKCKINKISYKELPEADDEFAKDVSEFDTLAEYKEDVKKNLTEQKEKSARANKENFAVAELVKELEADIPEAMIETEVDNLERDYQMQIGQQGIPYETYLQYMGLDAAKFRSDMLRPQAENQIKSRLALEAVAKAENIEISDDTLEEEIKKMAEGYGIDVEEIKKMMDDDARAQMKQDLCVREAVKVITDNAVEVEKKEEKEDKED